MLAKDLISNDIVPLRTSDTGKYAQKLMEEYKISHLPIVNNVDFLGLISEEDIYMLNDPDEPVGNHTLSLTKPYVEQYQHIYDVIKLFAVERLTLVPVLNKSQHYLGVITLQNLIKYIGEITSIHNPGGIIVLEVNENDYSMSEIANIVESNDAKILSSYITSHPDSIKLEITLKINKMDIYPVLQTFNRYNYNIIATFSESDFKDDLLDRYNSLMTYLNL